MTPGPVPVQRQSRGRIAVLFPEMLGTYGDTGNAVVLAHRLRVRGMGADVVNVAVTQPVPESCDVYLLGGAEDGPQEFVAQRLASGALARAVDRGAAVVGICGGLQILGNHFAGPDGRAVPGVGLLPCSTRLPPHGTARAVGDLLVRPDAGMDVGDLIGFENHRGRTLLAPGATPLGSCLRGFGNDQLAPAPGRVDGAVSGRVLGTYLHGPVFAFNPRLADMVLAWALGDLPLVGDHDQDRRVDRARRGRLARAR